MFSPGFNTDQPSGVASPYISRVKFTMPNACTILAALGTTPAILPSGGPGKLGSSDFILSAFDHEDLRIPGTVPVLQGCSLNNDGEAVYALNPFTTVCRRECR